MEPSAPPGEIQDPSGTTCESASTRKKVATASLGDSDPTAFTDSSDNASLNSGAARYGDEQRELPLSTDPNLSILTNSDHPDSSLLMGVIAPDASFEKMRLSVSSDSDVAGAQEAASVAAASGGGLPAASSSQVLGSGQKPSSVRTEVNRKESYKAQRKSYAREKKRVGKELLSTFKDQSIIVLADWLKVRGSLKSWTKLWCVLKPGLMLLYRSHKAKSSHWIGTIILSTCELIERPSRKDGFCFKLFHPMDQSIWASRGPEGETLGAVVQPLPTSHLIFRAPNNAAGKCWMDALELALRCSSLLLRTMSSQLSSGGKAEETGSLNESDVENHFKSELGESHADDGDDDSLCHPPAVGSDESDYSEDSPFPDALPGDPSTDVPPCSTYVEDPCQEVFGTAVDQTEEFSDENKSIVWFLVKQVRPGMDLSRVVLPTFILEPRSFLDKLTDYHYHNDLLSHAIRDESPYNRMRTIVKWYLSGFYKKPKGLKKPYNPILGETFRCYWEYANGSKTFYIAEQVSHHPPISAFYVANRQEGFTISSSILAKSKFYGNSTSAILEGTATMTLLPRGEEYKLTMPYAHCKGILMGTMTMELGGKVTIECTKTGYSTELEFKLRPFLGGGEFTNAVSGKIRLGKETLATIDGHWDDEVKITEKRSGKEQSSEILWQVSDEIRKTRLRRFTVPMEDQVEFESARLWHKVSLAIEHDDQQAATEEKSLLEEAQRDGARERKALGKEWMPKYFQLNPATNQYEYRHADLRAWDPLNDVYQYEHDFVIRTKTKHRTPMIRTQSIISVGEVDGNGERSPAIMAGKQRRRRNTKEKIKTTPFDGMGQDSGSTIPEESDGGGGGASGVSSWSTSNDYVVRRLQEALRPLEEQHRQSNERLSKMQHQLEVMAYQQRERDSNSNINRDMVLLVVLVVMIQALLNWILTHNARQSQHDFISASDAPSS